MNPITTIGTTPIRIVVPIAPGTRSVLELEQIAGDELIDPTGTTWTAACYDALTGALAFVYDPAVTDELVTFTAGEAVTAEIDPEAAYEIRIIRVDPGPDLIAAGPVLFDANAFPIAS